MTVLITGATGYIGSEVVKQLINNNYNVRAFIHTTKNIKYLKDLNVELIYGDFSNRKIAFDAVKGIDSVFHLGIPPKINKNDINFKIYLKFTASLLEACVRENVDNFLFASSIAVYGKSQSYIVNESSPCSPTDLYGISKVLIELLCDIFYRNYSLNTISFRIGQVYGGNMKNNHLFYRMGRKIIRNKIVEVPKHNLGYQLVHIKDIARVFLLARRKCKGSNIFNLVSDVYLPLKSLAMKMKNKINSNSPIIEKNRKPYYHCRVSNKKIERVLKVKFFGVRKTNECIKRILKKLESKN